MSIEEGEWPSYIALTCLGRAKLARGEICDFNSSLLRIESREQKAREGEELRTKTIWTLDITNSTRFGYVFRFYLLALLRPLASIANN